MRRLSFNHKPTYTVSAIETLLRCEKEYELKFVHGVEAVRGGKGRGPALPISPQQRGILVHEVMQFLDLPSLGNRETVIKQALWNQHIPDPDGKIKGEIVALTKKIFEQEEAGILFEKSQQIFREIPFLLDLNNFYIRGKIDAITQSERETTIIDYKTDHVGSFDEACERSRAYQGQMACYAYAVSQVQKGANLKTALLFTEGPYLVWQEWNKDDLSQVAHLLEELHQKLTSIHKQENFVYPSDKKVCLHCPYFELNYCGVRTFSS